MRYKVTLRDGKKPTYMILNTVTGKQIAQTNSNFVAANHIVMCLNMYEDLKEIDKLTEVLKILDDYGK